MREREREWSRGCIGAHGKSRPIKHHLPHHKSTSGRASLQKGDWKRSLVKWKLQDSLVDRQVPSLTAGCSVMIAAANGSAGGMDCRVLPGRAPPSQEADRNSRTPEQEAHSHSGSNMRSILYSWTQIDLSLARMESSPWTDDSEPLSPQPALLVQRLKLSPVLYN